MSRGYCIRCRRVVDVLIVDFEQGPWAVCPECHQKNAHVPHPEEGEAQ